MKLPTTTAFTLSVSYAQTFVSVPTASKEAAN
jgi:hypothetical protein